MDTKAYSEFIMSSLSSFDKRMDTLTYGCINKERLHNKLRKELIIRVKILYHLPYEERERLLDYLFKMELNNELMQIRSKSLFFDIEMFGDK